jgi:anti-sigma regulatory factor (Ser/Thr protein kinase)
VKRHDIEIVNQIEELEKIVLTLEELEESWGLSPAISMNLNLCLEEALTNVIFYAYPEKGKHKIKVTFILEEQKSIRVSLEDNGVAFNPLEEVKKPDVEAAVEDREIGGLGVFFIKQFMDEVTYQREGNTNQLIMLKQL